MSTETVLADVGGVPPATKPADAAPPAPASPKPATVEMTSDALAKRLDEERSSSRSRLLKELGYDKADDVKAALAAYKADQEARLTDQQKQAKALEELTPRAKRAEALEGVLSEFLAAEEKAIPEDKRGLLDLAPQEPSERLRWIARAKSQGLFSASPASPPTAPAAPPPNPATTSAPAGPTPPKPAGTLTAYEQHQQLVRTGQTGRAALYYSQNRGAINASRPNNRT